MTLAASKPVGAGGIATVVLKADSPVKGFQIDALFVQIPDESNEVICTVYRGNPIESEVVAQSGVGQFDTARGPYWLGPADYITVQWEGATSGLEAYAELTGTTIPAQQAFQRGVLRFEYPPVEDTGPSKVTVTNIQSTTFYSEFTNDTSIPSGGTAYYSLIPAAAEGAIELRQLSLYIPWPGGAFGDHRAGIVIGDQTPDNAVLFWGSDLNHIFFRWHDLVDGYQIRPAVDLANFGIRRSIIEAIVGSPNSDVYLYYDNNSLQSQPLSAIEGKALWSTLQ